MSTSSAFSSTFTCFVLCLARECAYVLLPKHSNHFHAQTILMSWKFFATHQPAPQQVSLRCLAGRSPMRCCAEILFIFHAHTSLLLCVVDVDSHVINTRRPKMSYWVLFYFVVNGVSNFSELIRAG